MKKQIFIILLVSFCVFLASCNTDPDDDISRNDTEMDIIVSEIGVSDATQLVIKKPYDSALDCDVYLVYIEEDGVISEYTYEFYGTVYGHNDALDYYSIKSVKKIYTVVSNNESACMVCVLNNSAKYDSIELLTQQYEDAHYTKQGYEIIR